MHHVLKSPFVGLFETPPDPVFLRFCGGTLTMLVKFMDHLGDLKL